MMSADNRCIVVAEIGPNHNGDFEEACRLVKSAAQAGADAVKFQYRRADLEIADRSTASYYFDMPRYDFIKSFQEFSHQQHSDLRALTKSLNLKYIVSAMTDEVIDAIRELEPDAIKIPSGEVNNPWLVEASSKLGIPVIISSGMSSDAELDEAVKLALSNTHDLMVLHCLSEYPTQLEDMNLKVIPRLAARYNLPVGLSDHSRRILPVATSVCYGARMIEVHFTHDRNAIGPDHQVSLTPEELKELVDLVRLFEISGGSEVRRLGVHSDSMRTSFTNGIVAAKGIKKGVVITKDDLCLRKPNKGLGVAALNVVLGSTASKNIEAGEYLSEDNVVVGGGEDD